MKSIAWSLTLAVLVSQAGAQLVDDDLVFGYSRSSPAETLALWRDGGAGPQSYFDMGNPWATGSVGFIQSVEFDNLDGIQHNAQGNLIGGNFGTTAGGGSISTHATNGASNGTVIATFNGANGYALTRLGSPAISPKNNKIAVAGYDSGELHIVDYTPGNGDGLTGSTSNPRATVTGGVISVAIDTQGSAWLNDRTALIFNTNGQLTAVDSTDMSTHELADVPVIGEFAAAGVTDVDFQPALSPYVYAMHNVFLDSVATNTLFVFDPRDDFSLVGQFDFSGIDITDPTGFVLQSSREIGFDSEGNMFISQFMYSALIGQQVGVDYIPGASNPNNIVDNGSLNTSFTLQYSANFNGIDVANSTAILPGDGNNDGTVDGADFTVWADNFGFGAGGPNDGLATVQMGDFNLDGQVDGADFTVWADGFGSSPAASVPEPSTLALAALGLAAGVLVARRRG